MPRYSIDDDHGHRGEANPSQEGPRSSVRNFDVEAELDGGAWWRVIASTLTSGTRGFIPFGSAGAIYGVELYAAAVRVSGVSSGIYHVMRDPPLLEHLDFLDLDRVSAAFSDQPWVATAHSVVVATGVLPPYVEKYGSRGYRFALLEAGQVLQVMVQRAIDQGLGSCIVGGFRDDDLSLALDLRPQDDEVPLCALAFGLTQNSLVGDPSSGTGGRVA